MAFDYTNYLEVDATVEADFTFTDRAGNVDSGLQGRNTSGQWCLETTGSTTSGSTGATANPTGRSAYIYTEASSPVLSTVWAMKRNDSFDNTTQDVYLDLLYNRYCTTPSEFYIEYATVASPNETTDWTILETILCNNTDAWVSDTFDFSGVASTSTLWIRIRFSSANVYTNDLCFSTWREYSVDTTNYQLEGFTYDIGGSVLGSCDLFLFQDNGDGTFDLVNHTTSNASTGAYLFEGVPSGIAEFCIRAWKDDTPHVFDISDYNLLPKETPDTEYNLFLRSDANKGESNPDTDLRLRTQAEKEGLNVSSVGGDSDLYIGETGIVITGSSFETEGANSRIRINSASDGTGTNVVQTADSWTDVSITFDLDEGALGYGSNYLFVRNQSLEEIDPGFLINLYLNLLTSGLSRYTFFNGVTGVEVNGSGFNATQGTSKIYLCDSADGSGVNVEQTVTDWTDTKVTFTIVRGALSLGTVYVIVARNQSSLGDSGERFSPAQAATLLDSPRWQHSLSSQFANKDATTRQLTVPSSGAFEAGEMLESSVPSSKSTVPDGFTEYEFCILADVSASGKQYEFRIVDDTQAGEKFALYSEIPKVTIT